MGLLISRRLKHLPDSFIFIFMILCFCLLPRESQGRATPQTPAHSKIEFLGSELIGSRPPRCEGRCRSCGHCEPIQVPTNPQLKASAVRTDSSSPAEAVSSIGGGGDDGSNYKPMSWKCKCGNFIFNP